MISKMNRPDFHKRGQTHRAYKRLLRFIHSEGLGPGDKLPSQQELWRKLRLNNSTLGSAMHALVAAGAMTRKPRVGTIIADLQRVPPIDWSVGLLAVPAPLQGPDSFFTNLTVRIQASLFQSGSRCVTYHRVAQGFPASLAAFPALERDLAHDELDGMIVLTALSLSDWERIENQGVVLCHTPIWGEAPCGVLIDEAAMAERAIKLFSQQGCRTFATVCLGGSRGLGLTSPPVRSGSVTHLATEPNVEGGRRIGEALLKRHTTERPDALIVFDDYVALGLANVLREGGQYRPALAVKTNRQLPLAFALPATFFEVDMDELVRRTISVLGKRLINPSVPPTIEWIAPSLVAGEVALPHR